MPRDQPATPYDLCERAFLFACRVVKLSARIESRRGSATRVAWQLTKCGTSVGANLQEAKSASSRADFLAKQEIALREAREAWFWLRIVRACELAQGNDIERLLDEANEIVAILVSSTRTIKSSMVRSRK